jgi:hypothetical protein
MRHPTATEIEAVVLLIAMAFGLFWLAMTLAASS